MRIQRLHEDYIILQEIDPFSRALLERIPISTDPTGSPAAEERIYSSPTHGADPDLDAEWKEYVEPDLRRLFQDAVEVVQSDLKHFPTEQPGHLVDLRLPVGNLEAWIHALNQARLALSARHGFTERDLSEEVLGDGGARALVLFQIYFYGRLQEFFLQELE